MTFFDFLKEIFVRLMFLLKGQKKLSELVTQEQKSLLLTSLSSFLVLFSYPLIRSVTTSIFLEVHGAKNSPIVWTWSVVFLSISISIYNKFQQKFNVHNLFKWTVLFSFSLFLLGLWFLSFEKFYTSYVIFIWKEVYIILLIHMIFGYLNASIDEKKAKEIFGIMGAAGALGGVIGGVLTSKLTHYVSVNAILIVGSLIIFMSFLTFRKTNQHHHINIEDKEHNKQSPIESIKDVKLYVFLIAALIIVTQFVINLANFKFNLLFSEVYSGTLSKTRYLGGLYAKINGLGLIIQLFLIPLLFKYVRVGLIHGMIPIVYMGVNILPLLFTGVLWPVATLFITFKGVDYSLFSAAKEILYFPLVGRQKYGAKYIADMFCYRFGKGIISFLLIYIQSLVVVDTLLWTFMVLWLILLLPMFKERKKILERA